MLSSRLTALLAAGLAASAVASRVTCGQAATVPRNQALDLEGCPTVRQLVEQDELSPITLWKSFAANFKAVQAQCADGAEPLVEPLTAVDPWLITGQAASSGRAFLRPFAAQATVKCETGKLELSYPLNIGSAVVLAIGFLTFMYGGSIASSDAGYYGGGFTLGAIIGLVLLFSFASRRWKEAGTLASVTVLSNSITGLLRRLNAGGSADALDSWNQYNPMAWLTMKVDFEGWGLGGLGLPPLFGWQVFAAAFVLSSSLFVGLNLGKPTPMIRRFLRLAATVAGLLVMASALPDALLSIGLAVTLALFWGGAAVWRLIREIVMYWALRMGCWCWPLPHHTVTIAEARQACRAATNIELERLRGLLRINMRHLAPLMVDPAVDDFARHQGFDVDPAQISEAQRESLSGEGEITVDEEGRLVRADEIDSDAELERLVQEEQEVDEDTDLRRRINSARKQREFVLRLHSERQRRVSGESRGSGVRQALPFEHSSASAHTPTGYHDIPQDEDSDGVDLALEWRGDARRGRSRSRGRR